MKTKFLIWSFAAMLLSGMSFTSCSKDEVKEESELVDTDDNSDDETTDDSDNNTTDDSDDELVIGSTDGLDTTGSDYYVFIMGDGQLNALGDKVAGDLRPDDITKFMYVWNGYNEGSCTGPNPFGEVNPWFSLVVTGQGGWSGVGLAIPLDNEARLSMSGIHNDVEDYYLHLYMKTQQDTWGTVITLYYGETKSAVVIGNQTMETQEPYIDIDHNGEWTKVEIPISEFYKEEHGTLSYESSEGEEVNLISFLSGATAGTTLDVDACFIYKKASQN